MKDVIFAWRTLRANPGFASHHARFGRGSEHGDFQRGKGGTAESIAYSHPERVVAISEWEPAAVRPENVDFTTTYDLRARSRSFDSLSLYRTELINGARVKYDFFKTLGVSILTAGRSR